MSMPEIVTEDFRQSLRSSPTGKRKNGTIFDELYGALETSDRPLDRITQLIAEFHGPWNGSSRQLTDFSAFLASMTQLESLKNLAIQKGADACAIEQAINQMPKSLVGKNDPHTFALMPTPLLREFVKKSQKIHPAINMFIQSNIGTFPYYRPISEDVGQYASVVMQSNEIDPMKWVNRNGVDCHDTNSRMNKNLFLKMFPEIFYLMDDAQNLTNTLFLRAMPIDNNMALQHQGYSSESPLAHGHNFTYDVFNGNRKRSAIGPCTAAVINLAQDVLRLINKFFCIKELSRYEVEGFLISMNEGPNGEPVTYIVDQNYRPLLDGEKTNDINDPTNDKLLGTKKEYKNESTK
jgi:hypothetical protein